MPVNLSRVDIISCRAEELQGLAAATRRKGDYVVVRCYVRHMAFENGTHVVSIQGEGLRDRAIVANNKAYIANQVMAKRSIDPTKVDLMIDDGEKQERMACRRNPKNLRLESRATGKQVDFTKAVSKRLAEQRKHRNRVGPER